MKNDPALRFKIVFWGSHCVLLAGIIISLTSYVLRHRTRPALPLYASVPEFTFTERSGQKIALRDLRGKIWIADFVFTHCAGPCPMMTSRMKDLQTEFANNSDVRLVSFSVDPERDTPEVLSEYANRYHAEGERWLFLTGDKKTMNHVLTRFYVNNAEDPNLHSLRFALVDSSGQIRGYYNSEDDEAMEKLLKDARALLHEEK